jgi:DNA-binding MarR family transcriptional regulator
MRRPRDQPALLVQQTAQILSRAERCLTARIAAALEDVGVERWRALVLLGDGEGHPMSEIARFTLLPAPSVTRLVDRMVDDNLAYRTADPTDGRRVLVRIAPGGERLRLRLEARLAQLDPAILGADGADVDQLVALLGGLVERIERGAQPAPG